MAGNFLSQELNRTFRSGSMVRKLVAVNIIVFLLIQLWVVGLFLSGNVAPYDIIETMVRDYLGVPASLPQLLYRPWTLITYSFTHIGLFHILFNMLWLYWLGNILTEFLGNKRILPVYLLGSVFGAALYILAYQVFPVFDKYEGATAIGASAGVMAIIIAAATLMPDYTIMLFIWPIRLKWLAVIIIVLDLINISSGNAGGHISHLGGALFGFIFIKQLQRGNDWSRWLNNLLDWSVGLFSGKPRLKVSYSKTEKPPEVNRKKETARQQEKVDAILDKISKSGYESLSKEEKEFLFKASRDTK